MVRNLSPSLPPSLISQIDLSSDLGFGDLLCNQHGISAIKMCTPGRLLMPEIMVKWLFPFDFLKSMLPNLLRKSLCCHVNAWVLLFSRLVDADIFFSVDKWFYYYPSGSEI
jgi:hypothetical protein